MEIISELQFSFFDETIYLAKSLGTWHRMTVLDNIKQIKYLKFINFLVHFIIIIHIAHWRICAAVKFTWNKYRSSHLQVRENRCSPYFKRSCLEVICKKGVLKNFGKFTGKHLRQSLFFSKFAVLTPVTLLKYRLWHRCFPVNFAKFLGTPFFIEHLWWLASGI